MQVQTPRQADSMARELRPSMRGEVLVAGDAAYDDARRIWNGAVDRHPAVIVRAATADDVAQAVDTAWGHGLPLSVRGGGHDWAGRALLDGGLVVDLSGMRAVTVNAFARTATAGGGATAGDLVAAAGRHGLAPVTGTVKAVGMAGLVLAGGYGPLNGKHGLALDNLVAAEVVLADGQTVTASEEEDPDLYWALRGGGGNFGVVTEARYRLHRLASVLAGLVLFPLSEAATVLRGYRELIAGAPDELTVMTGLITGRGGDPLLFLFPTWSGEQALGEQMVARLQQFGKPVMTQIAAMPYEGALGMFDDLLVNGRSYYIRTRSLAELTDTATSILIDAARRISSPFSAMTVHHFHGAASRVGSEETAFALRRDHLLVEIIAAWDRSDSDDGAAHRRWADSLAEDLAPEALPGGYVNLLGPEEGDRVRPAYGSNAVRLLELKERYDPDGVFSSAPGAMPRQEAPPHF